MRVSALVIANAHANVNHYQRRVVREAEADGRRDDLMIPLMKHYNPDFSPLPYFGYGCNCLVKTYGEFDRSLQLKKTQNELYLLIIELSPNIFSEVILLWFIVLGHQSMPWIQSAKLTKTV